MPMYMRCLLSLEMLTDCACTHIRHVQAEILRTHPHINVVDTWNPFTADGRRLLPMQLCDGDLLTAVERGGPLTERLVQRIFAQVVAALQHCVDLEIYHRDVKPEVRPERRRCC